MRKHSTLRSLCVSRIAPVIAALSFTVGAQHASAVTPSDESAIKTAIEDALGQIPGAVHTGAAGNDILKAKAADLVYAVGLVLENGVVENGVHIDYSALSAADVVEIALSAQTATGKTTPAVRADKDKIVADLITTAIASRQLSADNAALVVKQAFNVNSGGQNPNAKFFLSATGKANAIAAGLKSVSQDDTSAGDLIGDGIGASIAASDASTLLVNVSKSLGKSAFAAKTSFIGFVKSLADSNDVDASSLNTAAASVAASNPAAVGAMFGGFVQSSTFNQNLPAFLALAVNKTSSPKLLKAQGEILADTLGGFSGDISTLTSNLVAVNPTTVSLVVQGLIRGTGAVDTVLDNPDVKLGTLVGAARASFAGTVAYGNGDNITEITNKLVAGVASPTDKTNINTAIINGVASTNPEAAKDATEATLNSVANSGTNGFALMLATVSVPKIKVSAAAGAMSAAVVEATFANGPDHVGIAATNSAAIMAKGSKAATDIAYHVALLGDVNSSASLFADKLSDANKKFVLNAAVGASMAKTSDSAAITYAAITHDITVVGTKQMGDIAAITNVPKIAGAVATAVDVEQSSLIGQTLAQNMSDKGLATGKPIQLASLTALATSLAKAVQTKPEVKAIKSINRTDELGELGALLAYNVLGKYSSFTAESNAIAALGKAIFGTLSKKPLNQARTQIADNSAWFDVVGSIARSIHDYYASSANPNGGDLYFGSTGILATKLASLVKKDVNAYPKTLAAITAGQNGSTLFESGKDTVGLNDPETDTHDSSSFTF